MTDVHAAIRLKYEQACQECGGKDLVEDHAQGDLICRVRPGACSGRLKCCL